MKPIKTPVCNFTFTAPPSMDNCVDLPVCRAQYPDETSIIFSYWKPTWKERLQILLGGLIRLGVVGQGQPPVSINIDNGEA